MKKCWFIARRRRKGKEERERGKRERESRWCLGLEVHMSLTGPHKDACIYIIATITCFSEIENN